MHIPDGYLGPTTFIVMFVVMIPIWFLAFRKTARKIGPKEVPLLSILAALNFMVMMFNWPVLDGSTAHMVGGTLIAIILGPWPAVVAITVTLIIQAFIFGDGGITALGANCFNMAFVLPFVGYFIYILLKKRIKKPLAAGISAYIAINVAAIITAVEFGIQPYINPGYCPFGLNLSIPAMAFAHLTIAGPVEAVVTAIVILYLEKTRPELLEFNSKSLDKKSDSIVKLEGK
ncbi:MAG: cobalt transporter CbiM [Promethearchaeota archaeon]